MQNVISRCFLLVTEDGPNPVIYLSKPKVPAEYRAEFKILAFRNVFDAQRFIRNKCGPFERVEVLQKLIV